MKLLKNYWLNTRAIFEVRSVCLVTLICSLIWRRNEHVSPSAIAWQPLQINNCISVANPLSLLCDINICKVIKITADWELRTMICIWLQEIFQLLTFITRFVICICLIMQWVKVKSGVGGAVQGQPWKRSGRPSLGTNDFITAVNVKVREDRRFDWIILGGMFSITHSTVQPLLQATFTFFGI